MSPLITVDGMANDHILFNPGPESVIYTPDGRAVDSQDRVHGNPRSPVVKALLEAGRLIDQGEVNADSGSAAAEPEPQAEEVIVDDDAPATDESGD